MGMRIPAWGRGLVMTYLLALLALLAPANSSAVEPGVVTDLAWNIPDADKERSVAATQAIGSRWSRIHVQWREAEPQPGRLDEWWMAEYEEVIDRSLAAGQRVVVMIYNAPAWASGSAERNTPRRASDFASFAQRLATRFRGKVAGYEVWNEQNIERFWDGGPDAGEYARLLRAAYPAIKSADPAAQVIFGGMSGNDYDYLEEAYAAGAKNHFDVLGTHPYTYCGSSAPEAKRRDDGRLRPDTFTAYRELHRTMAKHDDARPIWVTEFGWNTSGGSCDPGSGDWQGGVSAAQQARFLRRGFDLLSRDPYVQVAIWYSLRDPYWLTDSPDDPEASTGLFTVDYGAKPAAVSFREFALSRTFSP